MADYADLSQGVVHYVERTGKSLVLDDAANDPRLTGDAHITGARPKSVLCAPIVHTGRLTGVLYFENNLATGVFTDERLEVLSLLSAQVSISIENSKLYEQLEEHSRTLETKVAERTVELKQTNDELVASVDKIQAMQQQIIVQEKLASLGTLTAGIAHELQNPLNFVNNFSRVANELIEELGEVFGEIESGDTGAVADARELLGDIGSTNTNVLRHGTRASNIISNMLAHASSKRSERQPCPLNEVVASAVNLAYHGVRAKNADFTLQIHDEYGAEVGDVTLARAELSRVIINIVNNACYATSQKAGAQSGDPDGYVPQLWVSTSRAEGMAQVVIRDNGPGIPAVARGMIFNPSSPPSQRVKAPGSGCPSATTSWCRATRGSSRSTRSKGSTPSSSFASRPDRHRADPARHLLEP